VAFATYAYAAPVIFSTVTDPDLRCDPNQVSVASWNLGPGFADVNGVDLTDIDPDCVGANLYLLTSNNGAPLADASLTVTSGQTGAAHASLGFTGIGNNTPVTASAADITGVSVLLDRGSEPSTGIANSPCELLGMRIDGWGVDQLTAMVSSVRLTDINPDCVGNTILAELNQSGTVLADGSAPLTVANTGANVLTIPLTVPGASTAAQALHASVITGIQVSVGSELLTTIEGGPTTTATQRTANPQASLPGLVTQVESTTTTQNANVAGALTSEVAGVRSLPQTGSGGFLGSAGATASWWRLVIALAVVALVLTALLLRRRRARPFGKR
jgi:hypothetical protein